MSEEMKLHLIELRDLESLLRKNLGDNLRVISFDTEPLLPVGENYGSTMLKVRAKITRNDKISEKEEEEKEEDLDMVAKMSPATDFQRYIFETPYSFKKEAFLYEEIIPAYQDLQRKFGVGDDEIFDNVPRLYGVRYSLKDQDVVDDDAVILMENLKTLGYYTAERQIGLDFEHARMALSKLAQFHALGMAMKKHRPEFFEILKVRSKSIDIKDNDEFEKVTQFYLRVFRDHPDTACHYDRLVEAMSQEIAKVWTAPPTEPWSTIVHSDFWVNNIMFKRDEVDKDKVTDVKFVDFQNYLFISPLRELAFFLLTNLREYAMENQFDELLDCYYDGLIKELKRMECDVEPFSRDKFDDRMKIDAFIEFPHCPFMSKVMTNDVREGAKISEVQNMMLDETANPLFVGKLRRLVKKCVEKNWL